MSVDRLLVVQTATGRNIACRRYTRANDAGTSYFHSNQYPADSDTNSDPCTDIYPRLPFRRIWSG
jgi:hypothetical protein